MTMTKARLFILTETPGYPSFGSSENCQDARFSLRESTTPLNIFGYRHAPGLR
jgi:hypothetical protein